MIAFASRFALETNRGVMLGLVVLLGKATHLPEATRIEIRRPRVESTMVRLVGDPVRRARLEAEIDEIVQRLGDSYPVVMG